MVIWGRARWRVVVGVVAVGLVAGVAPASAGRSAGWLQPGFDGGLSGFNPAPSPITGPTTSTLTPAWNLGIFRLNGAVLTDGVVVTITQGNAADTVAGYSAADGHLLWSHPAPGGGEVSADHGRVFYTSQDGLTALDPVGGTQLWNQPRGGRASGLPILADGATLYSYGSFPIVAVNEHNGHLLWHSNAGPGPLLAADGIVLAETTNGRHLVALHESDGSPAWTSTGFPPDRAVSTFDNLAAADGVGYSQHVSRTGSDVYAFGLATGSPIWHQAPRSGGVAVAGDDVYATSLSQLCAYESASGDAKVVLAGRRRSDRDQAVDHPASRVRRRRSPHRHPRTQPQHRTRRPPLGRSRHDQRDAPRADGRRRHRLHRRPGRHRRAAPSTGMIYRAEGPVRGRT